MKAGKLALTAALVTSAPLASADDYSFEIGLDYTGERFESDLVILNPISNLPITTSTDIDTDDITVFGSWYFNGLSDDEGPRARAAFVDRASVANAVYSQAESTASVSVSSDDPLFSPVVIPDVDIDADLFGVDGTFVSRDSGWFGQLGIAQLSLGSDTLGGDVDATTLAAGGGKYIARNTALGVNIAQIDADEGDATVIGVGFAHLGTLNPNWWYAIDIDYSHTDGDGDTESNSLRTALSFYAGRDIEFGFAIDWTDESNVFDSSDRTGFDFFGSWFITPNFRVGANYRIDNTGDDPLFNAGGAVTSSGSDQYAFGVNALVRF